MSPYSYTQCRGLLYQFMDGLQCLFYTCDALLLLVNVPLLLHPMQGTVVLIHGRPAVLVLYMWCPTPTSGCPPPTTPNAGDCCINSCDVMSGLRETHPSISYHLLLSEVWQIIGDMSHISFRHNDLMLREALL